MPRKADSRLARVAAHLSSDAPSSTMAPSPVAQKEDALLKFAFPKGSLQDATVELFERAQYHITFKPRDYFPDIDDPELSLITFRSAFARPLRGSGPHVAADTTTTPCRFRSRRSQEVSTYVSSGVVDVGICGHDWIIENGDEDNVVEVCELKYSKATSNPASWVLAVPEDSAITKAEDMAGMTVATELPKTTEKFFKDKGREGHRRRRLPSAAAAACPPPPPPPPALRRRRRLPACRRRRRLITATAALPPLPPLPPFRRRWHCRRFGAQLPFRTPKPRATHSSKPETRAPRPALPWTLASPLVALEPLTGPSTLPPWWLQGSM